MTITLSTCCNRRGQRSRVFIASRLCKCHIGISKNTCLFLMSFDIGLFDSRVPLASIREKSQPRFTKQHSALNFPPNISSPVKSVSIQQTKKVTALLRAESTRPQVLGQSWGMCQCPMWHHEWLMPAGERSWTNKQSKRFKGQTIGHKNTLLFGKSELVATIIWS